MAWNPIVQYPDLNDCFGAFSFSDHLGSDPEINMTWLMGAVSNCQKEVVSLKEQINKRIKEIQSRQELDMASLQGRILALERRSEQQVGDMALMPEIDIKIQQAVIAGVKGLANDIKTVEIKVAPFADIAYALHRELDKIITVLENLKRLRRDEKKAISLMKLHVLTLERQYALQYIAISELDQHVKSLEHASYDGNFIWKIAGFARKQKDASQRRSTSIYSPTFYTSRHGYKVCARLYPDGDGMGKGTHMSLFFVVMRGEYDALLQWPFKQRFTFCLVNQNGEEHILESFRPDPSSSSFKRPTTDMNIASGCPLFIRIDNVTDPNSEFLVDDTLFIKITVDVTDLRDPLSNV